MRDPNVAAAVRRQLRGALPISWLPMAAAGA